MHVCCIHAINKVRTNTRHEGPDIWDPITTLCDDVGSQCMFDPIRSTPRDPSDGPSLLPFSLKVSFILHSESRWSYPCEVWFCSISLQLLSCNLLEELHCLQRSYTDFVHCFD